MTFDLRPRRCIELELQADGRRVDVPCGAFAVARALRGVGRQIVCASDPKRLSIVVDEPGEYELTLGVVGSREVRRHTIVWVGDDACVDVMLSIDPLR